MVMPLATGLEGFQKGKENQLKWFVLRARFSKRPAHASAHFAAGELERSAACRRIISIMKSHEELVEITSFTSEIEAEIAKTKLESAGIDVHLSKDDCGGMRPQLQFTSGVRLYVLKSRAATARKILNA